jgi:SPX domain protein involved in polyphosphate accumulation
VDEKVSDARFEIKFLCGVSEEHLLFNWLYSSGFSELYQSRYINNIYFDTEELDDAQDNLVGISERKKLRVRWYGQDCTVKPFVEYKIKKNKLGVKKTYIADAVDLSGISIAQLKDNILLSIGDQALSGDSRWVNPIVYNRYLRGYFQSVCEKVRLTLDRDVAVWPVDADSLVLNEALPKIFSRRIIELKCDEGNQEALEQILSTFPFRPVRCSKYLLGVSDIYNIPYF